MEMRKPRLNDRYYLPWDPLQLSEEIDSGLRVNKPAVFFRLFRTYKRILLWLSIRDDNFCIFTEKKDDVIIVLQSMLTKNRSLYQSVRIAFYDFTGEWKDDLLPLDDDSDIFTYHPYDESFDHFIESVEKHRELIKNSSISFEPANKILQFLFIPISKKVNKRLSEDEDLRNRLASLLSESSNQRIYLSLIVEDLSSFPLELFPHFSQVFFLGEKNMRIVSEDFYPGWRITRNSYYQNLIGFGIVDGRNELVSLHPGIYKQSESSLQYEESIKEEERLYREFLASLKG